MINYVMGTPSSSAGAAALGTDRLWARNNNRLELSSPRVMGNA
jgi:hypothetical protein